MLHFVRGVCVSSVAVGCVTAVFTSALAQTPPPTVLPPLDVQAGASKKQPAKKAAAQPLVQRAAPKVASPESPTSPVVGYTANQSAAGTKTATPLLLTPQSVSAITNDELRGRAAESLTEALRYTPGITLGTYGSNSIFDNPVVRGFTAPTYIDGLRTPGDTGTDVVPRMNSYGAERIEVLRGSSSALYGQLPPGGLINITSKRPTEVAQNEVGVRFGSFNRMDGFFDFSGPLDASKTFLYRFVGSGKMSDTQIDFLQDNNYFLAPSFTFKFTPNTTLTVLVSSQRENGRGYQQYAPGLGTLTTNPRGTLPYHRYYGEPGLDSHRVNYDSIGYAFEHRFNDAVQVRQNLKVQRLDGGVDGFIYFGVAADNQTLNRAQVAWTQGSRAFAVDNQVEAKVQTGPIAHTLLAGLDHYDTSGARNVTFNSAATSLNIFNPVYGVAQPNATFPFQDTANRITQTGVYIQEQARLGGLIMTLTGRLDEAKSTVDNNLTRTSDSRTDRAATGRAALSYLFGGGLAPYVSYATNFQPTAGLDRSGNTFTPRTGTTKEVGIKYQPTKSMLFTAAYFDTDQNNVLTTDLVNPLFQTQTGSINVKGIKLEAKVSLNRSLDLTAGYARLDPTVTASNDGTVGRTVPNVALETASLWAMYKFWSGPANGLGLGGGVRYVGHSFGDGSNQLTVPSYTLFDAAATYDFEAMNRDWKGFKAQVNVFNLADTFYVTNCFGITSCGLGSARTVLGTVSYRW